MKGGTSWTVEEQNEEKPKHAISYCVYQCRRDAHIETCSPVCLAADISAATLMFLI